MRNDEIAFDDHQVVNRYTCPVSPALVTFACQVSADFARSLNEQPDVIGLPHPDHAAGHILAVVEDEWDHEVGRFYSFLHLGVLSS